MAKTKKYIYLLCVFILFNICVEAHLVYTRTGWMQAFEALLLVVNIGNLIFCYFKFLKPKKPKDEDFHYFEDLKKDFAAHMDRMDAVNRPAIASRAPISLISGSRIDTITVTSGGGATYTICDNNARENNDMREGLHVGDKVVMNDDFEGHGNGLYGTIALVAPFVDSDDENQTAYMIKFDEPQSFAHDGVGRFNPPEDHRYWTITCADWTNYFNLIESVMKKQQAASAYQPGTPITEYVDSIIATCKDKERLKWLKTFKNCILPPEVKETIEEALSVVLCADKFDEWGINDHFEKGLANTILLWGEPGTGKTMICESLAAILDKNLMKIDSGLLESNIPGQTERNIKQAFEDAKKENCVIMFDECDSVLSDRDMVGVIMGAQINCLLTEIERFDGVCVLTTNQLHRLDKALARRIVAKVKLSLPDKPARVEIWKSLIPTKMPIDENIDFDLLSTHEISGGDIKNAILLAARKAIAKHVQPVTMDHFNDALSLVVKGKKEFEGSRRNHRSFMLPDMGSSCNEGIDKIRTTDKVSSDDNMRIAFP